MTFQELKQLKNDIAVKTGLDTAAAARVIGYYNGAGASSRPDIIQAMINGDMSPVGPALVALGITPTKDITPDIVHTSGSASAGPVVDNITAGDDLHDGSGHDLVGGPDIAPDGPKIAPQRTKKTQASKSLHVKEKTITSPQALQNDLVNGVHDDLGPDDIELIQGDIITDDPHALPPGLYDDIVASIEYYCQNNDIKEPKKMHPHEWKSLCIYIGQSIKARRILQDTTRLKEGGFRYDPQKLVALLNIYDYTCGQYKQVPFEHNFARFAGVSLDYLKDYMKRGLTSSHVGLAEKAHDIQRAGLIDGAAGGGSAAVPLIFLCKSLGGLNENTNNQDSTTECTQILEPVPDLSRAGLPGPV